MATVSHNRGIGNTQVVQGNLIAAFGIPGCGKSSICTALGGKVGCQVFHEPEEGDWPAAVQKRQVVGCATAIQWFRSIRVPQLYEAEALRQKGKHALVDSYFDKLCYYYLGKPGMEWLISPEDPYFLNIHNLAKLDLQHLPDADALISITVAKSKWKLMLKQRGRKLDKATRLEETHETQRLFQEAASRYTDSRNGQTELIEFHNNLSSVDAAAESLFRILKKRGVI